jgi:hypothetical protein
MKSVSARRGKAPLESKQPSKRSDISLPVTLTRPSTKLTHDVVRNAQAPATGSVTLWDSEDKGFGIRIFAATARYPYGAKSYFINYRKDGRERRFKIASYPDWTVSAARDEAKKLRKRIDAGKEPDAAKTERREAPTVDDLVQRYIKDHLPTLAARGSSHAWFLTLQKRLDFTGTYDQVLINSLSRKERLVRSRKSDNGKRLAEERTEQCHSLAFGKTPLIRKLAGYLERALLQRLRWKQHIEDSLRETAL